MFGFFFLNNYEISKFDTFTNQEYQLLIFKKFPSFTHSENKKFNYLKNTNAEAFDNFKFSKHLIFNIKVDDSQNLKRDLKVNKFRYSKFNTV
jgi:hypothetical protein